MPIRYAVGIIIFSILVSGIIVQHRFINLLGDKNLLLESQMESLKVKSQEQAERYEAARERALFDIDNTHKQSKLILASKVPENCNDAIKWGINEAHSF